MQEMSKKNFFIGAVVLFGLSLICLLIITFLVFRNMVVFIEPDKRGVVLSPYETSGYRIGVLEPGRHLISFGERVRIYDISPQTYTMSAPDSIEAQTLDGKTVHVDISVIYALDPQKILDMHIHWQDRYEDNLVRPLSRSITRETISFYNINDLDIPKVEQAIFEVLSAKFAENDLILVKFSIISIQ